MGVRLYRPTPDLGAFVRAPGGGQPTQSAAAIYQGPLMVQTVPPAHVDRALEAPGSALAVIVGSNWPASPSPSDDTESTTWSHELAINSNRRHRTPNAIPANRGMTAQTYRVLLNEIARDPKNSVVLLAG